MTCAWVQAVTNFPPGNHTTPGCLRWLPFVVSELAHHQPTTTPTLSAASDNFHAAYDPFSASGPCPPTPFTPSADSFLDSCSLHPLNAPLNSQQDPHGGQWVLAEEADDFQASQKWVTPESTPGLQPSCSSGFGSHYPMALPTCFTAPYIQEASSSNLAELMSPMAMHAVLPPCSLTDDGQAPGTVHLGGTSPNFKERLPMLSEIRPAPDVTMHAADDFQGMGEYDLWSLSLVSLIQQISAW